MNNSNLMQLHCITTHNAQRTTHVVFFLLFCSNIFAQSDSPFKNKVDSMFIHIDKSPKRIPTRLLLETGFNLVQIDKLQGTITPDNQVNFKIWNALHNSLYTANVDPNKPFQSYEDIQTIIAQYPSEQIQLPILRVSYNTLNPMGAEYQWFKFGDGHLYDTPKGLKANPFDIGETFAIAPTQDKAENGTAEFVFRKELFVNNTGLDIIQIEADFDDGNGGNTYNFHDPISITWSSSGIKDLQYVITFSDGSIKKGHSVFEVTVPIAIPNGRYTNDVPDATVNIGVNGYTLQIGFSDVNKANNPTVLPANLKIRKPFIILDGIDQLNKYDYKTFMFTNDLIYRADFKDSLAKAGYDLVYCNYAMGGAHITYNADHFKTVINYINAQKALAGSTEQNVVMGVSMGGLVARYALADMYRSSLINPIPANNSQVRLLITHDSPHQGANVPAGIHVLARKLVNTAPILSMLIQPGIDLRLTINADAAKDMMNYSSFGIPYVGGAWGPVPVFFTANSFLADTYHPMVHFPAGGVPPPPYKFIATSQGSECGLGIISPGQNLINSSGGAGLSIGWGLLRAGVGYDLNINAGDSGLNRVIYVNIYASVRVFWFITVKVPLMLPIIQWNPYPGLLADSQPGSITSLAQANFNKDWDWKGILSFNATTTVAPGFCFVSRNSALDLIPSGNFVGTLAGGNYANNSLVNVSRANEFITQEGSTATLGNLVHTTFTLRQTRWIFEEMQQRTAMPRLNCPVNCNTQGIYTLQINPNPYTGGFSANSSPAAGSYIWSITGGPTVISGQGTPNIRLSPLTPGTFYTLTVTATLNCWTRTTTQQVTCNVPTLDWRDMPDANGESYICPGDFQGGFSLVSSGATHLVIGNKDTYNGQISYSAPIAMPVFGSGQYVLTSPVYIDSYGYIIFLYTGNFVVYVYNNCGNSQNYSFRLWEGWGCKIVAPTPKNTITNFTISPNPSSGNEITISQEISEQSEAKNEEFTLILYNKLQVKVRKTTLNAPSKTISTEGLPNDVYFLHIIDKDGNKVVKQVMILR